MKKYTVPVSFAAAVLLLTGCATQPKKTAAGQDVNNNSAQSLIQQGRFDDAKKLFETTVDINAVDTNGNTVLHIAALKNNGDLVTFLLAKNADPSLKNYESDTPLLVAIKNDSYDAVRNLIAGGSNIFTRDGTGKTALELALARSDIYYDIMITQKNGNLHDNDGDSIVHYFVKTENEKAIDLCIKRSLPLSEKDKNGDTPLALALKNIQDVASVRIAAALLSAGVKPIAGDCSYFEDAVLAHNLSLRFDGGQTPLHIAAMNGQRSIASYLLANGVSTDSKDISGAAPLHEAVRYGHTDVAQLLLQNKADANAPDTLGKSPLLLIIPGKEREQLYSLLLSSGANTKAKDMYGDTVLHIATMTAVSVPILQQMVDHGADINARNKQGVTPLAVAIEHNLTDHIQFYISHNADINTEDVNGRTPLTYALADGLGTLKLIVTAQNVNSHDSEGNTPLHTAILKDASRDMVQYILSLNGDINMRNSNGNTPLYLALRKNRRDIGELLLSKDANIFSTNTENDSPLRLALTRGGETADWLLTSKTISSTDGSGNTALHYAAEWGLGDAVRLILEKGANPDQPNANGETALFSAVRADNPEIVDLLIKGGASKTVRDHMGNTPLHIAVRWSASHSIQKLIELGVDIDARNIAGMSPLAEAAIGGKTDITRLLLDKGASPNSSDTAGRTILVNAIRGQSKDIVAMMLASGANPNIQELDGQNAYHEAVRTGNVPIIEMIYKAGGNPLSRDKNGNTPFSLALRQTENVIRATVGTDKTRTDSDGNTFAHAAVQNKAVPAVLVILAKEGYPTDTRNAKGYTPLTLAVTLHQNDNVEALLAGGANPFVPVDSKGTCPLTIALAEKNNEALGYIVKYAGTKTDMKGNGILHYAAQTADTETVSKLIRMGLDRTIKNISGETAYDIAVNWKRPDIAALLKS